MTIDSHWVDTVQPDSLVQKFGSPLYIYSEEKICRQVNFLQGILSAIDATVCYAVKANSNLAILSLMKSLGCGFDVVSEGELRRVLKVEANPKDVVFAGVGKQKEELELALRSGIGMINVESPSELRAISSLCRSLECPARIALRINPDIDVKTHPYLSTGLSENKFGIPIHEASLLWDEISQNSFLQLVGVDCHIGSHVADPKPLLQAYTQIFNLGKHFESLGAPIECIDLGGGFTVRYEPGEEILDMQEVGRALTKLFSGSGYRLIIEPGKYLSAEAGVLLTRVVYTKNNYGKDFVIVDAGMNDLIRPPLYQAHHALRLFRDNRLIESKHPLTVNVVGPVCETGCFLAKDRHLAPVQEGDILAVLNAGAYCFAMASNYNSRRFPAEVLIEMNGSPKLIGRRQGYDELWERELF